MAANPVLGVFLHWIGGLAAASFYVPYRQVRRWSWETYWLVGGIFSWIVMPTLMAWLLIPDVWATLSSAPSSTMGWAYFYGALWGIGGLTFGLTMRYLGIALGMAVALGYTTIFGTLVPPIFHGEMGQIAASVSGRYILLGVVISVAGIAFSGIAGMSKERELTDEEKRSTITEFHFVKGMAIATFSGVMSSCMAFGLDAGKPLADLAKAHLIQAGRSDIWKGLPVLIVVLLGGFTSNFFWCVFLNLRNHTTGEYFGRRAGAGPHPGDQVVAELSATEAIEPWDIDEAAGGTAADSTAPLPGSAVVSELALPLVSNYLFSALAGITWYLQFFFYTMGQTKMGAYSFSSWTLHMASIMIFSMLWGVALHEWKGTSARTHGLVCLGLAVLIGSTIIIGYGNSLAVAAGAH